MSTARHLAFDFGAESGRAIVGTIENGRLTLDELHRFPTKSVAIYDSLRWNIYRFYEEILTGLRKYVARFGSELASIGIDTWGVDYGFLKDTGVVVEIPYQYRDERTQGTDEVISKTMGRRHVYDITGIQFMNINTLNQLIAVRRDEPAQMDGAAGMLFIGDILHYFLSGEMASEFTVASTSQMLDAFTKTWSDEIFEAFCIPRRMGARIVQAGDVLGTLRPEIAREVGLSQDVKIVTPAVHDTASAATAIPAKGDGWAYISSGTWCMVGIETDQPVITDSSFAMNISNSGGSLGKNLFLKNVMGLWMIQQCKKAWDRQNLGLDYPAIVERAIEARPFAAFLDPDDDLFFAPEDSLAAVRAYLEKTGQPPVDTSDVGTVARLVYEALALKYRYIVERLQQATGCEVRQLHVIGGGAKNGLLNQFTADALGIPVLAGPGEATAMGNLLLQAYGCGEIDSLAEIRRTVAASSDLKEYTPVTETREDWENAYGRFTACCSLDM